MQYTPTQLADIGRIYLTIMCVVVVVIIAVWAVLRTNQLQASGTIDNPGVPVVSAGHDDAALSSLDQGRR